MITRNKIPSRITNDSSRNGVMHNTHRKNNFSFLTYQELLVKRGLLPKLTNPQESYGLWQRVKEDRVVVARSIAMAKRNRPHELPSCHSAQTWGLKVLRGMTAAEVTELKQRLNIS